MIVAPSTLRSLVLARPISHVCSNDADEVAWVEQVDRRFVVMRARHDASPTRVAELTTRPSLAFVGSALYAGTNEGVVRLARGHAAPIHVFEDPPSEVILKGTASLLAIVRDGGGAGWEVLELGERVRSVGTYDERPLAVSTMGAVWVAGMHVESEEPLEVTKPELRGATAALQRVTWRLESDVASGPEVECGRVRTLVALGTSDERVPKSRGGVVYVERRDAGDGISELWPDGSDYRHDVRPNAALSVAPYGDGICWSEGRRVWRIDSDHDEPALLLEVEPDAMVQSLFAAGRSLLLVTSGGYGTPTSLRWLDRT